MHLSVLFARLGPYHVARLRALGREHQVTAVELSGENLNYAWDPVNIEGLNHAQLFGTNHRNVGVHRLRKRLTTCLEQCTPDAVVVPGWWDPGALLAIAWARHNDIPVVLMSDSTALDAPRPWWREWPKRRVVSLCESAIVAGRRHTKYLVKLGMPENRIWRGYDVVDNEHFAKAAKDARNQPGSLRRDLGLPDRYILSCCRFIEKKNLARLVRGYAEYRRRSDTPRALVLVGDGPRRDLLERLVDDLGMGAHVYFPGFCQYDALPPYYGLADAFVLPSTHEQWGLVVNEAMAAGLPVLVSERCGCAPDLVIEGENGHTFDPYDVDGIADALFRVPNDDENRRRMGRASRERIRDWTPQTFARNLSAAAERARHVERPTLHWDQALLLRALTWKTTARVT